MAKLPRIQITQPFVDLVHMQVCAVADASDEEILETCNRQNPAGTEFGWTLVLRGDAFGKEVAPVNCESHPGRTHFLVRC